MAEYSRFKKMVTLKAFRPFSSRENALENITAVSEGALHSDLAEFLRENLVVSDKKSKKTNVVLGINEDKLGTAIFEKVGVRCNREKHVRELLRGVRMHFGRFLKGLDQSSLEAAQLGLGHAYSRAKVKYNINRVDNMIIQSISLLDQVDKDLNTFAMRLREWYAYHFPELIKIVPDNILYAKLAFFIRQKDRLTEEHLPQLEEITLDAAKAQEILDAARSSFGQDSSDFDIQNAVRFAEKVVSLAKYRAELHTYLSKKMHDIAPNLSALVGEIVGARLISHAGSLTSLAKYPASTVQILGAEKALFRALKARSNTPKYGLIFNSTFIGRAGAKNKGRISRYLANKISIASRIDCFADVPTDSYGVALREQVEERLRFYETGEAPRKNVDVMAETCDALQATLGKKKLRTSTDASLPLSDKPILDSISIPSSSSSSSSSSSKKSKKDKKAVSYTHLTLPTN